MAFARRARADCEIVHIRSAAKALAIRCRNVHHIAFHVDDKGTQASFRYLEGLGIQDGSNQRIGAYISRFYFMFRTPARHAFEAPSVRGRILEGSSRGRLGHANLHTPWLTTVATILIFARAHWDCAPDFGRRVIPEDDRHER